MSRGRRPRRTPPSPRHSGRDYRSARMLTESLSIGLVIAGIVLVAVIVVLVVLLIRSL